MARGFGIESGSIWQTATSIHTVSFARSWKSCCMKLRSQHSKSLWRGA